MDVIDGGGDPTAHLHRRARPHCDWCQAPLPGPMPHPFWLAATSRDRDEHGHPQPEDASVRVYLCAEHRTQMTAALDHAWRRERDRTMHGQRLLPSLPHLNAVDPETD